MFALAVLSWISSSRDCAAFLKNKRFVIMCNLYSSFNAGDSRRESSSLSVEIAEETTNLHRNVKWLESRGRLRRIMQFEMFWSTRLCARRDESTNCDAARYANGF